MFVPLTAPDDDAFEEDEPGEGEEAGAASVMRRDYRCGDLAINPKLGAIWRTIDVPSGNVGAIWRKFDPPSINVGAVWRRFDALSAGVGANWREFDSPNVNVGANWRIIDVPNINVGAKWRRIDPPSADVGAIWRKLPAKSIKLDAKRQKIWPLRSRSEHIPRRAAVSCQTLRLSRRRITGSAYRLPLSPCSCLIRACSCRTVRV